MQIEYLAHSFTFKHTGSDREIASTWRMSLSVRKINLTDWQKNSTQFLCYQIILHVYKVGFVGKKKMYT